MEIVTRPQPREAPHAAPPADGRRIAAIVLAAGRSTRMGGPNKLLAEVARRPLVRIAAEQALASRAKPVIVVVGHQRKEVEKVLSGLQVRIVHNPDFAEGLGRCPLCSRGRRFPMPHGRMDVPGHRARRIDSSGMQ